MNTQNPPQLDIQLEELAQDGEKLQKKHDGVEAATLPVLAKCLEIYRMQFHASESDNTAVEEKILLLKGKLNEKKIRYLEKSPPLNLLIRLVTGKNTERASAYSRVVESAFNRGVTEEKFVSWVQEHQGIEAIRKNMPRNTDEGDGELTIKAPKKTTINTKLHAAYARQVLANQSFAVVDKNALNEKIESPMMETEYVAVLVHHVDGTIEIKTTAKDESSVELVFASIAREKGWDKIADANEQQRQLEDLLKKETLKLVELRDISKDLADQCQERWKAECDMATYFSDIPVELEVYRAYLKQGDACENLRQDSGEKYFEKALETLEDAIKVNSNLQIYLYPEFTPNISPNAEAMPRFKTTKSKHVDAAGGTYKPKQQDVYRQVAQSYLEELKIEQSEDVFGIDAKILTTARLTMIQNYLAA